MTLALLAYVAGILTIVSPCILPVLPFVFARADGRFLRSGLPLLAGMVLTFAVVATLAAVAGSWAVAANEYGRIAALVLLGLFGLALLFPAISDRLTRPLVALGGRLSNPAEGRDVGAEPSVLGSLVLGVATGLLWAPCAGPVLGLVLTGAALQGANVGTSLLLLAYAAGAATSLALALLAGGRVFAAMKRSLGAGAWIRRGLGAAVLAAVLAVAMGLDTGFLTQVSLSGTASLEQRLVDAFGAGAPARQAGSSVVMPEGSGMTMSGNPAMMSANPAMMARGGAGRTRETLPVEGEIPSLDGAAQWLNGPPLTREALRGKVVLIDFWTYSCINCLRAIPYVRAWAERYKDQGLVVIGVHAPEFAFEKSVPNVERAVADLGITYPVAIDNGYAIWRAFDNQYWPAHYFVDAEGRIRHHHFGEGDYEGSEGVIRTLLAEVGRRDLPAGSVAVEAKGAQAASAGAVDSPETYIGHERAENFVSPGGPVADVAHVYSAGTPRLNEWGLSGDWTVGGEHASLNAGDGGITYRFRARDLHLVLGPGANGRPVRFRVTLDGAPPGDDHGLDVGVDGEGTVMEQRLYQLVRQHGAVRDRTFEIRFLDPGVEAYAFTFG